MSEIFPMSPRLIAANWKMNKTTTEAVAFVDALFPVLPVDHSVDILLIPPFPSLQAVGQALKDTPWKIGAQNMFWETEGAFTGEVSGMMLKDVGCQYVIIGHSERRKIFGETDQQVNKKVHAALNVGLAPILCVGESLDERESGQTPQIVARQITEGLQGLTDQEVGQMTFAYEPVWAIGTGRAATVQQVTEVHALLRTTLRDQWKVDSQTIRILYGGSVTSENAPELFQSDQVNGALIGKACLNLESFARIVNFAAR